MENKSDGTNLSSYRASYESVENSTTEKTGEAAIPPTSNDAMAGKAASFAGAFQGFTATVKDELAASALVISIVGYIIIAAFGELDAIRYYGYIAFLFMSFALYKFAAKTITIRIRIKQPNPMLIGITVMCVVAVVFAYRKPVGEALKFVWDHIPKK